MNYPDSPRLSAQRLEHELPGSAVKRVCQIELFPESSPLETDGLPGVANLASLDV